jgi:hypothetical protein
MRYLRADFDIRFAWLPITLLLAAGCSHSGDVEIRERGYTRIVGAQAPSFLTGPASVLLTNSAGFSARVSGQAEGITEKERNFTGVLLGQGAKLFYAPDADEKSGKQQRAAGLSYIWNVAENRGYVLSETMQAYAPFSHSPQITNVVLSPLQAPPQKLAGHQCEPAFATVQKVDGNTANFEILRATDLNNFPVRLTSTTNSSMLSLNFSKIRLELPGASVFEPPSDFTKYSSPEAMVDELAARQHNLRRKRGSDELLQIPGYTPR